MRSVVPSEYKERQMLQETFFELLQQYNIEQEPAEQYWEELVRLYSANGRHYHTLSHLSHMLQHLNLVKEQVSDWNTILFSLYYHDAIYDASAKDNEAQSAELAALRMQSMDMPVSLIEKCKRQIMATKEHRSAADPDTDFLIDADLTILGRQWPVYKDYSEKVRLEYAMYPDAMYQAGRKTVLRHFLDKERIFKTTYFFERFERQARQNLQREYNNL